MNATRWLAILLLFVTCFFTPSRPAHALDPSTTATAMVTMYNRDVSWTYWHQIEGYSGNIIDWWAPVKMRLRLFGVWRALNGTMTPVLWAGPWATKGWVYRGDTGYFWYPGLGVFVTGSSIYVGPAYVDVVWRNALTGLTVTRSHATGIQNMVQNPEFGLPKVGLDFLLF